MPDPPSPGPLHVKLASLPTLPSKRLELLQAASDPHVGIDELVTLVSQDPSLAAQLLKTANSPLYGFRSEIATIREGVVALGTRRVRGLASAVALAPTFRDGTGGQLNGPRLWSHAVATAVLCEALADLLGIRESPLLYTAGLLHDIGLLALNQIAPVRMAAVLRTARAEGVERGEVEQRLLGTRHEKVGAILCAKWFLPNELTLLVSNTHHGKPAATLDQILCLADWLASSNGFRNLPWESPEERPEASLADLGVSEQDLAALSEVLALVGPTVASFG